MRYLLGLFFLISSIPSFAQKVFDIYSPNKLIRVDFLVSDQGEIAYRVYHKKQLVLEPSKLGILRKDADFSKQLSLLSVSKINTITDQYTLLHGKKKSCTYIAKKRVFSFREANGKLMDIVFQVADDGVAFRYIFKGDAKKDLFEITEELSSFNLKEDAVGFLQPNMDSKSGWNKTQPSYEEHYQVEIPVTKSSPTAAGWVLPALFKSNQHWVSITEAAVDTNYCGARLKQHSPEGVYTIGFPQVTEGIGDGAVFPQSILPWYTPWRVITITDELATLVESTHGTDLALPAAYQVDTWLKPGKASWSWIMFKDGSINYDMQKRYIDFASTMQWQYCLIDVNWDRRIGYDGIRKLSEYAATKKVKLILWYNSAGDWNTVTFYTPRNKLLTHASRMEEFKLLREMGIAGIKVDFFPGDGQSAMKYYIDILKDAALFNIAVNFHGSTYPRGWARTYPNLVTMEAIKGEEFITFNQQDANAQPVHCTLLPFTRNLFDPMDFTPVNLAGIRGIKRRTTKAFELSLSVLFLSGVQHFAESDSGMIKQQDFVIDFMKHLPDSWDDVKFMDGYPGKYVVIARRSGNQWYIAGINGENKDRTISLDLSFISKAADAFTLITDKEDVSDLEKKILQKTKSIPLTMKSNGGFILQVTSTQ
jgi:alpha-glucosidase